MAGQLAQISDYVISLGIWLYGIVLDSDYIV